MCANNPVELTGQQVEHQDVVVQTVTAPLPSVVAVAPARPAATIVKLRPVQQVVAQPLPVPPLQLTLAPVPQVDPTPIIAFNLPLFGQGGPGLPAGTSIGGSQHGGYCCAHFMRYQLQLVNQKGRKSGRPVHSWNCIKKLSKK